MKGWWLVWTMYQVRLRFERRELCYSSCETCGEYHQLQWRVPSSIRKSHLHPRDPICCILDESLAGKNLRMEMKKSTSRHQHTGKTLCYKLVHCSSYQIQRMRVSKIPPIRPSRYGHEKRKCWSQFSAGPFGRKVFFLSKKWRPWHVFLSQNKSFSRLLFVDRTNIYKMVPKNWFPSHQLQRWSGTSICIHYLPWIQCIFTNQREFRILRENSDLC